MYKDEYEVVPFTVMMTSNALRLSLLETIGYGCT